MATKCEVCGGTKIVKQEGIFVCQKCGIGYTLDEIQRLNKASEIDKFTPVSEKTGVSKNDKLSPKNIRDTKSNQILDETIDDSSKVSQAQEKSNSIDKELNVSEDKEIVRFIPEPETRRIMPDSPTVFDKLAHVTDNSLPIWGVYCSGWPSGQVKLTGNGTEVIGSNYADHGSVIKMLGMEENGVLYAHPSIFERLGLKAGDLITIESNMKLINGKYPYELGYVFPGGPKWNGYYEGKTSDGLYILMRFHQTKRKCLIYFCETKRMTETWNPALIATKYLIQKEIDRDDICDYYNVNGDEICFHHSNRIRNREMFIECTLEHQFFYKSKFLNIKITGDTFNIETTKLKFQEVNLGAGKALTKFYSEDIQLS